MATEFYIIENNQQLGPFKLEDLKLRKINKNTLVWHEGLDNWTKAEHISLLKDSIKASPPPMPEDETNKQSATPPPPFKSQQPDPYFGYQLASCTERFIAAIIETIILLVPLLAILGDQAFDDSESPYTLDSIISSSLFSIVFGAILYPVFSGNLGHKLIGLKVISSHDGSDCNKAFTGALRELLKTLFSLVFLPVIWLIWDKDNQNLYDKMLNTYVVKKK